MSHSDLFDHDYADKNRFAHWTLLALAIALMVALYAWMMHEDAQSKTTNEHHWGKPSITQQQSFREDAREQLRLTQLGARP
mgnify:CR=1 FL=1